MAGLIFTISILSILMTVGVLFAWMVRLASSQEKNNPPQDKPHHTGELAPESIKTQKP